jgi:beta-galactosidase GanA
MYVNTWLGGWADPRPSAYPHGGPLPEVMDVWKAAGDSIDIYSGDIYVSNFADWCNRYQRPDNPLFVPEAFGGATGAAQAFYTIGQHDGIGYSPFGIDGFVDQERASDIDTNNDLGKSYEVLADLAPVILQHEGRGEMAGFLLDKDHPQTTLELSGYHLDVQLDHAFASDAKSAFGLVIATGPDEFLGAGTGFGIAFSQPGHPAAHVGIAQVDEGAFSNGQWVSGKRLNGDEDEQGRSWRFIPSKIHIEKITLYQFE